MSSLEDIRQSVRVAMIELLDLAKIHAGAIICCRLLHQ